MRGIVYVGIFRKREEGAGAILLAVFLFAMLAICALVLGFGMASSEKLRLKNIANIAALAAMEEYSTKIAQPGYNPSSAKDAAVARVTDLLNRNKLATAGSSWAKLEPDDNTGLKIGAWYVDNSDGISPPPCSTYPCFIEATSPGSVVNAAQVRIRNKDSNPIVAPFVRLFGTENLYYSEGATAAMVPRCIYFLLDASRSSVVNTHPSKYRWQCDPANEDCSWFAYSMAGLSDPQVAALKSGALCSNLGSISDQEAWGRAAKFCWTLNGAQRNGDTTEGKHYMDDYKDLNTTFGRFLVDTYLDPMPLAAFLRGFNTGVTQLKEKLVGGDRAGIIAFHDGVVTDTGLLGAQMTGARMQMDLLLQLTNLKNRGTSTSSSLSPNFLDWGWFPYREDVHSNLTAAVLQAASTLADPAQGCPRSARKIIIMGTDGMVNCVSQLKAGTGFGTIPPLAPLYVCQDDYSTYSLAKSEILGGTSFNSLYVPGFNNITLPDLLKSAKISLSVMLAGDHVQPNFKNVQRPSSEITPSTPTAFLFPLEAAMRGYCGVFPNCTPAKLFFSQGGTSVSYTNATNGTGVFRSPNGLWGHTVMRSGGVWCPLMPPYPGNALDGGLVSDSERTGSYQFNSIYNEDLPGQAMRCVREALGVNPYTLVGE